MSYDKIMKINYYPSWSKYVSGFKISFNEMYLSNTTSTWCYVTTYFEWLQDTVSKFERKIYIATVSKLPHICGMSVNNSMKKTVTSFYSFSSTDNCVVINYYTLHSLIDTEFMISLNICTVNLKSYISESEYISAL